MQCKYQLTDWVWGEDASVYNVVNQYRKKKHVKIRTDNHQRNCVTVTKEKLSYLISVSVICLSHMISISS